MKSDHKIIDRIIKQTVAVMDKGRENINEIGENARIERDEAYITLEMVKKQALETIEQVDRLHMQEKQARLYLMEASKNFGKYKEEDIRDAYDQARELQLTLGLMQEREKQLRIRRDHLEMSLRRLNETTAKSEEMYSRVGIALDYLIGNLRGIEAGLEEVQQKQSLGLRIILAQEEERKRVAREIHDGPAQSMASLVLRAEICEKLINTNKEEVKEELQELKTMVRGSLQEIRKIIFDLRPMALDDLGLIAALRRYLEEFQEKHELIVEFVSVGSQSARMKDMEIAVFRIIQEALNNVAKHAAAGEVLVKVEINSKTINVVVRDNGCGFDLKGKRPEGSFGIMGIQERVELLYGTMLINTAPGKGTELIVNVPINEIKRNMVSTGK